VKAIGAIGIGVATAVISTAIITGANHILTKKRAFNYAKSLVGEKGIINLGAGPHRTFQAQVIAESPEVAANVDIIPNGMPHFMQWDIEKGLPFADKAFDVAFCLSGDTRLLGSSEAIAVVKVDDLILGLNGLEQPVLEKFQRNYNGTLIKLSAVGPLPVLLTPEHPVLVTKVGRRHVKSWHRGSKTKINKYVLKIGDFIWKEARDLNKDDWLIVPRRKTIKDFVFNYHYQRWREEKRRRRRFSKKLTPEIAEFFGLYVAEGSIAFDNKRGSGRVSLSFGRHEKQLVNHAIYLLDKFLGIKARAITPPSLPTSAIVQFSCHDLAKFLKDNFGTGAHNKYVAEFIKDANERIIRGFIRGWYQGDGNLSHKTMDITTVSPKLANDLLELLYKIGISASLYKHKNKARLIKGWKVESGISYQIRFSANGFWKSRGKNNKKPYGRIRFDEKFAYLPIRNIERLEGELPVYNLHTQDETICVPYITHNCSHVLEHLDNWEFALSEASRVADHVVIVLPHPLSPAGWLDPAHKQHFSREDMAVMERAFPNVKVLC